MTAVGFQDHEQLISSYVSSSPALADLLRMLQVEQEDAELRRRLVCAAMAFSRAAGLFFAGCDLTGLPLFEEACFAGLLAAEGAMRHIGAEFETSLRGLAGA